MRKFVRRDLPLILGMALFVLMSYAFNPEIKNVVLHRNGTDLETALPVSIPMASGENFSIDMDVSAGFASDFYLNIHPDDCVIELVVNDVKFPVESYPGYCSWNRGFVLDKAEIVKNLGKEVSDFHVRMSLRNGGGLGGLTAVINGGGFMLGFFTVMFFVLLGALIFSVGSRFNIKRSLLVIFFIGLLLRVGYGQETFYDQRGHDVGGHVHYMKIIAEQNRIPSSNECWTCYHPPVYFVLSAGVWKMANLMQCAPQNAVKWFDLLISFVALGFGLACLRNILEGAPLFAAALLWSVWPSFILASPRLGNDILFYAMHAVALWGCLKYIRTGFGKYFIVAVVASFIAYWTKSTAVVTFGVLALTALLQLFKNPRTWSRSERVAAGLFVAASVAVACVALTHDVVGNAGGNDNSVLVRNNPGNFLFFDLRTFLTQPYTDPWHDELGRQFFWNYLAKTSLFGEFKLLESPKGLWLASIVSACFVALLGFGLRGFWKSRWDKVQVVVAAQAFLFFAAMIALRLKYPFSCSNDFRYIVPVLLSCLPWVGYGFCGDGVSRKLKVCGWMVTLVFVVCSSILMMSL